MKNKEKKGGLILSPETIVILRSLKGEDRDCFLDCVLDYHEKGSVPSDDVSDIVNISFKVFRMAYDTNQQKYKNKCDKNRENIRKRYEKIRTYTNENDGIRTNTNATNTIQSNVTNVTNLSILEDKSSLSDCSDDAQIDFDKFIQCWNNEAVNCNLKQIKYLTDKRKAHLNARLKECVRMCNGDVEKAKEMLFEVIMNAAGSDFLNSKCPQFGNFDWIFCKPNNFVKVLEGNYN